MYIFEPITWRDIEIVYTLIDSTEQSADRFPQKSAGRIGWPMASILTRLLMANVILASKSKKVIN